MNEKLKPCSFLKLCPFCGDVPYTQVRTWPEHIIIKIGCGSCGAFLTEELLSGTNFDMFDKCRSTLIDKWNRRADNE